MKKQHLIFSGLLAIILSSCIKDYKNPAEGTPGAGLTIFALRQVYQGNTVELNANTLGGGSTISGIVISNNAGNNIDGNAIVVQENQPSANAATDLIRGIMIKLNGSSTFNTGDSVRVTVTGGKIERLNGRLAVTNISNDKVQVLSSAQTPLVRSVTQGMLHDNMDQYESTLVSLNADVVDYNSGATLAGLKKLSDHTGPDVYVHSMQGSAVAALAVPQDAQFTGIAGYYNQNGNDTTGAVKTIMMRTPADLAFVSNVLYPNFPESFEAPDISAKSSYNTGTNMINLGTGSWTLLQAILANTPVSDKYNPPGKQGIRMQQNLTTSGYLQMNFDLPDGASKVTVFYGRYGTDAKSSFRLEYSTNAGTTWTTLGSNITDMPEKSNKQAVWTMNITGPVRFRINKLGIGTSNNGRLSFDDFAVYKKL